MPREKIGSFWWKDVLRLNILYRGIAKCTVGDGTTVTFWGDLWSDFILETKFPVMFSFAKNKRAFVHEVMRAEDLDSLFHPPLSLPAWEEMLNLQQFLSDIPYIADSPDEWTLIWGNQMY